MHIKVIRKTNAPAKGLWKYLSDFSNIHRFHPFLKDSHFVEGSHSCEVGATRQCNFKDGTVFKERIKEWNEGSDYTIEVVETNSPIRDVAATLGVNAIDAKTTVAYMSVQFKPKKKLMQPLMYLMFRFRVMPAVLKSLEEIYHEEKEAGSTLNLAS